MQTQQMCCKTKTGAKRSWKTQRSWSSVFSGALSLQATTFKIQEIQVIWFNVKTKCWFCEALGNFWQQEGRNYSQNFCSGLESNFNSECLFLFGFSHLTEIANPDRARNVFLWASSIEVSYLIVWPNAACSLKIPFSVHPVPVQAIITVIKIRAEA